MDKTKEALEYFRNKFNCSQSVLTPFGTEFNLSADVCLKIATAFGGGMGRQQQTCGAVTGALMAIGLRYGKGINDEEAKKQFTYSKTREFFEEFIKIHGTTNCRELLDGLDMTDPEGHKKIIERNLFELKCEKYVADAVKITEKLLK